MGVADSLLVKVITDRLISEITATMEKSFNPFVGNLASTIAEKSLELDQG
jgi:membrane protease subunit (stomatin/prohibitin family)